ncbi:uncharacterized protein LOC129601330 [Paramacrobiotus metropolitanus]|uniref:uncharacterized protein LOC129601330 n=1 Tax=Paramacrobiotus metropolitanus TaxID=2943436 RepID=UPI002446363B|nr:uncharacterized protein LOC129601330 [Paramacrobiotus metropolitanus]XP_055356094.1 uncharacterized protein LOC129601330 [Paramacrobiotus metropolitanus]
MASHIPVLDFNEFHNPATRAAFGKRLVEVFCSTGFVYLKNHGVDQQLIDAAFQASKDFFTSPIENKKKYSRPTGFDANAGYVCQGMERLNAFLDKEHETIEVREAYNFLPFDLARVPPALPLATFTRLFHASWELTKKIFDCLAVGLDLPVADLFQRSHALVGQRGNPTTLRTLWYPPVDGDAGAKDHFTRCGTHSDYGTLTLLYQDDVGGLEVENRKDEFVPATPMPGCVLVNVADLLQRWTTDKLRSTRHRVGFSGNVANQARQSMAFFVHPDDNYVIRCLDGSEKYPPISAGEYLQERFKQTY